MRLVQPFDVEVMRIIIIFLRKKGELGQRKNVD